MSKVMILINDGTVTHSYSMGDGSIDIERYDDICRNDYGIALELTVNHYDFTMRNMKPCNFSSLELRQLINYLSNMEHSSKMKE